MKAEYAHLIAKRYTASLAVKDARHPAFLHVVIYPLIADAMYRGLYRTEWTGWWTGPILDLLRADGFAVMTDTTKLNRKIIISWAHAEIKPPVIAPEVGAAASTPSTYHPLS